MNLGIRITNQREFATEAFQRLRAKARLGFLVAALFSKNRKSLKRFSDTQPKLNSNRKFCGIVEIPVEQITGSANRAGDFDSDFRPLKNHLRDRWVSLYLLMQTDGWPPIQVHKVGDDYFVEDGHHRVSVARFTGLAYIPAEVWEYTLNDCETAPELESTCIQSTAQPVSDSAFRPVKIQCPEISHAGQVTC